MDTPSQRRKKEWKEREKAIARDSLPYKPSEMPSKIPIGCLIFLLSGVGVLVWIVGRIIKLSM